MSPDRRPHGDAARPQAAGRPITARDGGAVSPRPQAVPSTPARLRQRGEPGGPPPGGAPSRRARDRWFWALLGAARAPPGALPGLPPARRRSGDHRPHGRLRAPGRVPRSSSGCRTTPGVPESYAAAPLFFLFGISRRVLDLVPALGTLALALAVYRTGQRPLRPRGRSAGHSLHHRGVGVRRGELHARPVVLRRASARRPGRAPRRRPLARPAALRAGTVPGRDRHGPRRGARSLLQLPDRGRAHPCPAGPAPGGAGLAVPASGVARRRRVPPREPAVLGLQPHPRLGDGGDRRALPGAPVGARRPRGSWSSICLPVVLGVRSGTDQPAHLPGPLAWTIPVVVGGAVLLLLARVVGGPRTPPARCRRRRRGAPPDRDRRDARRGLVRRVRPRPALPPAPGPPARARPRARGPADVALDAGRDRRVGGRVPPRRRDGPGSRHHGALAGGPGPVPAGARGRRAALRRRSARRTCGRPTPSTTGSPPASPSRPAGSIIVAQPFNDRHPPHTLAVDRSPRPAYVVQAGVETFRAWLDAMRVTSREDVVGEYHVFHDFTPPPDVRPLARSAFTVRASAGRGEAASVLDAQPRHRLVERPGPERLGLDRGGPRSRARGERGHARERPRRARAGRPGRDGRARRLAAGRGGLARAAGCRGPLGERRDPDHAEPDADRALRAGDHPAPPARREGAARALERGGAVPAGPRAAGSPARCRRRARRARAAASRTRDRPARRSCATTRRCAGARTIRPGYEAFARLTTRLRASVRSPLELRRAARGPRAPHRRAGRLRRCRAGARAGAGPRRALAASRPPRRGGRRRRRGVPALRRGGRGARAGPAGRRR